MNKLAITGSVVRPGFYAWSEGQTFQELLVRSNGFDRGALKSKAVLIRRPENSLGQYIEFNPENSWETTLEFNPDSEVNNLKRIKTWTRKVLPKEIL